MCVEEGGQICLAGRWGCKSITTKRTCLRTRKQGSRTREPGQMPSDESTWLGAVPSRSGAAHDHVPPIRLLRSAPGARGDDHRAGEGAAFCSHSAVVHVRIVGSCVHQSKRDRSRITRGTTDRCCHWGRRPPPRAMHVIQVGHTPDSAPGQTRKATELRHGSCEMCSVGWRISWEFACQ
jgi:hypothetical protein